MSFNASSISISKLLKNKLKKVNEALNDPDYYVYNYFKEIEHEIDLYFDSKLALLYSNDACQHIDATQQDLISDRLTDVRFGLIEDIQSYCVECRKMVEKFQAKSKSKLNELKEIENEIGKNEEKIQNELTLHFLFQSRNQANDNMINEIKTKELPMLLQRLDTFLLKIERELFLNKTAFFLSRDNPNLIENLINPEGQILNDEKIINCRLIFISNFFFDKTSIDEFIRSPTFIQLRNLSDLSLSFMIETVTYMNLFEKVTSFRTNKNEYSLTIDLKRIEEVKIIKIPTEYGIYKTTLWLFKNLRTINISGCGLTKISAETFSETIQLRKIILKSNNLVEIDSNLFSSLINLRYLHLGSNKITKLSKDVFAKNKNLRSINLSSNQMREIHEELFASLSKLEHLNIYGNYLRSIPLNVFEKCFRLNIIFASYGFNTLDLSSFKYLGLNGDQNRGVFKFERKDNHLSGELNINNDIYLNTYFTQVYKQKDQLYELTDADAEQEEEKEKKEQHALEQLNAIYSKRFINLTKEFQNLTDLFYSGLSYYNGLKINRENFLKALNEINELRSINNETNIKEKEKFLSLDSCKSNLSQIAEQLIRFEELEQKFDAKIKEIQDKIEETKSLLTIVNKYERKAIDEANKGLEEIDLLNKNANKYKENINYIIEKYVEWKQEGEDFEEKIKQSNSHLVKLKTELAESLKIEKKSEPSEILIIIGKKDQDDLELRSEQTRNEISVCSDAIRNKKILALFLTTCGIFVFIGIIFWIVMGRGMSRMNNYR